MHLAFSFGAIPALVHSQLKGILMDISQQAFADAVIGYVEGSDTELSLTGDETQPPDLWSYRTECKAMSGSLCLVYHGMFDSVYRRAIIIPREWGKYCEQFYTPEARLLMHLYRECQQPSLLTWSPYDTSRDDSPMTRHFWTKTHQNETYVALRAQLRARNLIAPAGRRYAQDPDAFGVKFPGRVIAFPGSYRTMDLVVSELRSDDRYVADIPRDIKLYGDSTPVLHMIGNTVEARESELSELVAAGTGSGLKSQQVVYVLSESRNGRLTARHIGYMNVTTLEIAYGSLAGAIHGGMSYLVPNDLSADELTSFDCSSDNWELHRLGIIQDCPVIAEALGI